MCDRERLRAFALSHGKNRGLMTRALEAMDRLFEIGMTETDGYPLADEAVLRRQDIASTIARAVRRPGVSVEFTSASRVTSSLGTAWFLTEPLVLNFGKSFNRLFGIPHGGTLSDRLRDAHWHALWERLGRPEWRGSTGEALDKTLLATCCPSHCFFLGDSPFLLLGSALADQAQRVDELAPLVSLFPDAVPLGEKEPDLWLVLAK